MKRKAVAIGLSLLTLGTALAYTDGNTATNTVRISVEGHAVYPDEDGNIGLVYKVLGDDSPIIAFQNYVEIPVTPHLLSQYRTILDAIGGAFPQSGWYKIPSEIFDPLAQSKYDIMFSTVGDPERGLNQIVLVPIPLEDQIPAAMESEGQKSEYLRLRENIGVHVNPDSLAEVVIGMESPAVINGKPVLTIIEGSDGQREVTLNYERSDTY
ncbi:MAG: hypothetical protein QGH19_00425 [Candidatus Woesearchaeota archaeon]|mgnify:CR=1 FL=1|jgi:hypothetical protein|nr:hypothetical protein [Candidatus Woesearchaeota archaeon]|tara:strand:+ start:4601 stop:5233 length:633 start_codon:yes stop_codon:yes gene_type:complete